MTRYSARVAIIGVAFGYLWLAATSGAKEFPVQSMLVSPIAPSVHPQAASPGHVVVPFRPFDPAELQAARDQGHAPSLNSHQPATARAPQRRLGSQASVVGGLSWAGLAAVPGTATDTTPPDGGAGIGPNAFIEAINHEIAVYNRTTTALIASLGLATFFHGASDPCDPYVLWDNGAQRWVVTSIECATTTSHTIYLAFTKSTDPSDLAAGWCTYSIDTGSEFADFPKTGHNNSDWLIGTNDFSTSTQDFDTAQLWAFEKPASGTITACPLMHVDSTSPAGSLVTVSGAEIFTPNASDQLDSGAPPSGTGSDTGYFVAYETPQTIDAVADEIDVIDFNRDASGMAHFILEGDIPVTPFNFPFAVPQPGALPGDDLDPSDMRGLGATSHVDPTRCSHCEAVWLAHAIDGPGNRSQIQWDEVDPAACTGDALCGSGALLQDGLLSSPSLSYWNPRISPDGFGNEAVMNFNAGSATQLPEIMAVSSTPADAPGATGDPIVIQTSSHPDDDFSCPSAPPFGGGPVCRWGDYPAAEADPLNPGVVWNNSMYTAGAVDAGRDPQWGTQNFAIRVAGPATSLSVSLNPPSIPANGTAQAVAKVTVADAEGNPVQGDEISFDSTDGGNDFGAVTDNHDGTYTAPITSSTRVGTPVITAKDNSVASLFGQATLTQTLGPATAVAVRLSPSSILADGTSQSTAKATITDALHRLIAGDQVSFSSSDSGDHIGAVTDNHDGTYTATITSSTTAGAPAITATDTSVAPGVSGHATLTQTLGPATTVAVRLSPSSIVADGTSQSTATATISDAVRHPIAGDQVSFSSSDSGERIGAVTDNHNGTYTATITGSRIAGTSTIIANDTSVAPAVSGQAVLTQTSGRATTVAVTLSPSSIVADGTSQSAATATITDALGHLIAGEQVSFSSSDSADRIGPATDNHNGTYMATITSSTTAGTPTITATDISVTPPVSGEATLTQTVAKPVITNLTESHHRFRVGKALATVASSGSPTRGHDARATSSMVELARLLVDEVAALAGSTGQPPVASAAKTPPVGTVFSFTLNTTAQIQLAFAQPLPGRRVRGKCVAPNNQNQNQAKCRRTVSRGSIRLSAHAGTNRVSFAGLVSRKRKLGPGHDTMTLTATNSTGPSTPKTISFTVVK